MGGDDKVVRQLKDDCRQADLPDDVRAMLDYAVKLARRPEDMEEEDVQALRDVGFSDKAILNIVLVVSAFSYLNRVADGLGVELDSFYEDVANGGD